MSISRYGRTKIYGISFRYGTSYAIPIIRQNINDGNIKIIKEYILKESDRLDIIAGKLWNDSSLWWIIAASSNIGYGLQVPSGILIRIPDLKDVLKYVS